MYFPVNSQSFAQPDSAGIAGLAGSGAYEQCERMFEEKQGLGYQNYFGKKLGGRG